MRISDWSSDVCSSDLGRLDPGMAAADHHNVIASHAARDNRPCLARQKISVSRGTAARAHLRHYVANAPMRRWLYALMVADVIVCGVLAGVVALLMMKSVGRFDNQVFIFGTDPAGHNASERMSKRLNSRH